MLGGTAVKAWMPSGHGEVPGIAKLGKKFPQKRMGASPAITVARRDPASANLPHNKYSAMALSIVIEYHRIDQWNLACGAHKGFVMCVAFKSLMEGRMIVTSAQNEIRYLADFIMCPSKKWLKLFKISND
jgi:hypothetical protein